VIQDLSGSWCIKGTGESTLVMDSPIPLIRHDPDRSWITDPDPDHPKGTQPYQIVTEQHVLLTLTFGVKKNTLISINATEKRFNEF